jgi:hypothetical protein
LFETPSSISKIIVVVLGFCLIVSI